MHVNPLTRYHLTLATGNALTGNSVLFKRGSVLSHLFRLVLVQLFIMSLNRLVHTFFPELREFASV